jgi:hypothetical protein
LTIDKKSAFVLQENKSTTTLSYIQPKDKKPLDLGETSPPRVSRLAEALLGGIAKTAVDRQAIMVFPMLP